MGNERLRTAVRFGWIPVAIGALYVAWVFYSRHDDAREIEKSVSQEAVEKDRETLEKLGGDKLTILTFYGPPSVQKGAPALICYGVSNATKVRMEPPDAELSPSLSRCVEIKAPDATATYTLIANNDAGEEQRAELILRVD